ncbi:SpaA isopeptide-forming pilin-related protein [Streptomyces sp. UNOB3_S3]|uniref:SpaA isopeptide-forming pilin-related protein n=1 Tax=Streptomyces sp. UNOB3_S3 TaxID=2871682 RepID=UPI001E4952E3|nr:SpaA isopeptide-forming pilin-related protein [Streptomyces sp. UNOB3_S3]MCC3775868.1 LPXTG cell wall anchor domain-containing protein [Streptomyces sp. UNOB3_S3]
MHTHSVCYLPAAALTVAAAVTGTLAWAPTATAHTAEPTPTATAPASNAPDTPTGGVQIRKKDPSGAVLGGAQFSLLNTINGTKALQGTTNSEGILRFEGVTPGVYRLKETSTGSSLHELVPDQDVIVTAGQDAPLTIIDPFKPADLTVKKTDKATDKPLAGAVISVAPTDKGDSVTLTTGKDGTASAKLPVFSRTGTEYTATETKAPAGYQMDAKPVKLTAKPGAPVAVTLTNTATGQTTKPPATPPASPEAATPSKPSAKPTPDQPAEAGTAPSPSASSTPLVDEAAASPAAPGPEGSLAHTGADATPWLLGGAGVLLVAGGGAVIAARRRRTDDESDDHRAES